MSPTAPAGQSQIPPSRYPQASHAPLPTHNDQPPQAHTSGNPPYQEPAFRQQPAPPYSQGARHSLPQAHPQHRNQPTTRPAAPPPDLLTSPLDLPLPSQASGSTALSAPPIPPNPEKDALLTALGTSLLSQLHGSLSSNAAAQPRLQAQHAALLAAQARLQAELEQLQALDAALATDERILGEAMREADRAMGEARGRRRPDVDDVLVAPTVVAGQLYALAAEERACEEARAVLRRGVDAGRVGWEGFVKVSPAALRL